MFSWLTRLIQVWIARREQGYLQGAVCPFQPVSGPSAWTASDYKNHEQWIYRLSDDDVKELEAGVQSVIDRGLRIQVHTAEHLAGSNGDFHVCNCVMGFWCPG